MLAKTLLSLIFSPLLSYFCIALLCLKYSPTSYKMQNKKPKGIAKQKKRKSGMNASYSNYFMNSNLLLTEFISKLIKTSWYHLFFPTFQLDNIKLLPKKYQNYVFTFFWKVDKITFACQQNANTAQLCWHSGQPWQRGRANWSRRNSFFQEISWCHLLLPTERKYFSTLDFQKPLENGLTRLQEAKCILCILLKMVSFSSSEHFMIV